MNQDIFTIEDQQGGLEPEKPKKVKTGNELETIASTKLKKADMIRLKEICAKDGMTPYEELQLHCLTRIAYEDAKRDGRKVWPELEAYIQSYCYDSEQANRALKSLRKMFQMPNPQASDGEIEYAIMVRKGGIVEVFDPHDPEGVGRMGCVTASIDKALEILLTQRRKELREVFHRVKEERGLRSLYFAIYTLFSEEYRYIGEQLTDEQLDYAQNEYGVVPKQKRNTYQMR